MKLKQNKFGKITIVFLLFAILASMLALTGCASKDPVQKSQFMLDTNCTITVYGKNADKLIDEGFALGTKYENLLSTAIESSDVYKVNHAEGKPVQVSNDTIEILNKAISYSEKTDGLFDVSIGALTSLWDFPSGKKIVPKQAEIDKAKATVGYKDIKIEGNIVTLLRPGAQLDFGGIAKGYIGDKIAGFLRESGVDGAIVNLGGNVVTVGKKPNGKPWNVGIQQPFADRNKTIGAVEVGEKDVVTSGIYERSFTVDGKFYHHILDPRTGYPADNNLESVTIISNESGDGLTSSCFLLGEERALKLVASFPNTEAIFVQKDGKIITSPGIGKTIPFQLASPQGN
ncbi:MAG: FAD:protein FMN transferase [Eubacteriales bacterium]